LEIINFREDSMKKLKNISGNNLLFLYRNKQVDFEPSEELLVQDDFLEVIKNQLNSLVEIKKENKSNELKVNVKKVNPFIKKLNKMSFKELRKLGYEQTPEVRGKSKKELIEELSRCLK